MPTDDYQKCKDQYNHALSHVRRPVTEPVQTPAEKLFGNLNGNSVDTPIYVKQTKGDNERSKFLWNLALLGASTGLTIWLIFMIMGKFKGGGQGGLFD